MVVVGLVMLVMVWVMVVVSGGHNRLAHIIRTSARMMLVTSGERAAIAGTDVRCGRSLVVM